MDRAACVALDLADPLAGRRDAVHAADGVVYLDGNSLGALPVGVAERMRPVVDRRVGRRPDPVVERRGLGRPAGPRRAPARARWSGPIPTRSRSATRPRWRCSRR